MAWMGQIVRVTFTRDILLCVIDVLTEMDISHNTTVTLLDGKSLYHLTKIWLC
jgi:hypothetical protein